jgi:SAM-dependent methyltransferase
MLQTITPEYADLNRQHHERDPRYGSGSWRWAQEVLDLREIHQAETVLDYGCGKGNLKRALEDPEWFHEYDPAVSGKTEKPRFVDMVVCTDVLEHIEPDLLENVLTDIKKLTRKIALLVIATRPAKANLPDGSNTHKIIQDADWWREQLGRHFYILSVVAHGPDEMKAIVTPIRQVGEIIPKSAVSETLRYEQSLRNCGVVAERVPMNVPRHERRVCIVAYGPTLKDTWHTLRAERKMFGATIVTVSGAHDFLIERGIVPDYHIEVDPREHKGQFTKTPHPSTTYWIASCCHPKLIDNIKKTAPLALWHVFNNDTDLKIVEKDGPDPGGQLICGGGSVGCRAVNVMFTQGYRTFSMYGMDCSFNNEGEQHAGAHPKRQKDWNVRIGDRWFRTSANLLYTARGFLDNYRVLRQACEANNEPFIDGTDTRIEVFLHGDGMLQHMAQVTQAK